MFTVNGEAKFALWEAVDLGLLNGLSREVDGPEIQKTFKGNQLEVWKTVYPPKPKLMKQLALFYRFMHSLLVIALMRNLLLPMLMKGN